MIPVYQTINNAVNGNCWAAVWASLLHLDLKDVPNFVEQEDHFGAWQRWIVTQGYEYNRYLVNGNRKDAKEEDMSQYEWFGKELPDHGHVNGYYEACVYSTLMDERRFLSEEGYTPICHAVIVDKHFNIVHDPNAFNIRQTYPLAKMIGYNGVIGVTLVRKIK